jgi:two-component system response regulator AlgR
MPGIDGLEVASHLAGWQRRPAVVFTTAFDEYAIQAFEAQAVGYLLKPVRRERLQQTLEHAARVSRAQLQRLPGAGPRSQLCVARGRGFDLVPVAQVRCFQADQKYVTVLHSGGEALLTEPLKDLEEEFGDRFLRVHRNALVAVAWIEGLERREDGAWQVRLKDGFPPLPVSRRHAGDVKRRLRS